MQLKQIAISFIIIIILFAIFDNVICSEIRVDNSNIKLNEDLFIDIDCKKTNGIIKKFSEINCGPLPNQEINDGVDLSVQYKDVGINFIRTHDFNGPTDISTIFPDFNADPKLEENYNFESSDKYINSIINSNSKVFYRLGESASTNESLIHRVFHFSIASIIARSMYCCLYRSSANGSSTRSSIVIRSDI